MAPLRGPAWLLGAAVFLLGCCLGDASHSLRYFFTSVSDPGQQVLRFSFVGYVDDQPFVSYDPNTRRVLPEVPWMSKVDQYDPEYWEWNSQGVRNDEETFRVNLVIVPKYYNQSGGGHTWQWMYGCELRKDGSRGGYVQFGYDGRSYIAFDKETLIWTAADPPAQKTKRKWDPNLAQNQYLKSYLEEICIGWLQRYLDYGRESLQRTEPPDVKVTRKAGHDNMETLICHVYGFYPKAIDIAWTRDGEVWMQDTFSGLVSPNSDGTYYSWRSIRIDPKDREHYGCRVDHDGLRKPVDVAWEEPPFNLGLIIGCAVVAVLLVAGIAGIAVYIRRRQDGYKAASALPPKDEDRSCSAFLP